MKLLLQIVVGAALFAQAWSITCHRCGGSVPSCKVAGSATVECESPSMPDSVYACQIYTVNYTSYDTVQEFKGCCLYEDCDKNPCDQLGNKDAVCSKMASCQSDKCNFDYKTAKASQRPTLPSRASRKFLTASVITLIFTALAFLHQCNC
ncbi:hypothetical protein ABFA07_002984 [Porites harrisoni]